MNRLLQLLTFLALVLPLRSATINAASTSRTDVMAALSGAVNGDNVVLPAGSSTWSSSIGTVPVGVRLTGAGVASTIITIAEDQDGLIIGSNCIVEDIAFVQSNGTTTSNRILSNYAAQDIVIRNCSFTNICGRGIVFGLTSSIAHPTGVVHNCVLTAKSYGTPSEGSFQLITVYGGDSNYPEDANPNTGSLKFDPGFGTASAVFIEDCTLSQNSQGDSTCETYYGGKLVIRYNTATNLEVGTHGRDSGLRTGHIVEIYENTITNNIGSSHFGTLLVRGGSGVVWGNTITGDHANSNRIVLQSYRSAGQLAADQANYLLRFPYQGGQFDGHDPTDGNTAVANGTGTHTGAADAAILTDSTKAWGANELDGVGDYTLTNNLQPYFLWNLTKKVGGRIVANSGTTATVDRFVYAEVETPPGPATSGTTLQVHTGRLALFPATPFDARIWQSGLDSATGGNYEIVTVTGTSSKTLTIVRAQGGTSAIAIGKRYNISVESGARMTWSVGDSYTITNGYPGLDQPGRTGPTAFFDAYSTQTLTPLYAWDNTYNGSGGAAALPFVLSYMDAGHTTIAQPDSDVMVQENREYYNNTAKPGYTPYTYPHPLHVTGADVTAPVVVSATIENNGTTLALVFSENVVGVNAANFALNSGTLGTAVGSGPECTMPISPLVQLGAARTLSYTAGTTVDTAGTPNALANFSGAAVINNSIQTTTLVPGRLRNLQILNQ